MYSDPAIPKYKSLFGKAGHFTECFVRKGPNFNDPTKPGEILFVILDLELVNKTERGESTI